jgi:hypothetical protein
MEESLFKALVGLVEQFGATGAGVVVLGGLLWKTLSIVQGAGRLLWPKIEKAFDNFDLIARSIEAITQKLDANQATLIDKANQNIEVSNQILTVVRKNQQGDEKFPGGER